MFDWLWPTENAPVTEADLSIPIKREKPRLHECSGDYALQPGFWVGVLRSRREGKSLGPPVMVAPKKDDFPVPERQPYQSDSVALARHERMAGKDDVPGTIEVILRTAESYQLHRLLDESLASSSDPPPDVRETQAFRDWLAPLR